MTQPTTLPLTYTDLVCIDDADRYARETTSDLQNLEQDVLHMLIETRGSNLDDLDRGIGLEELLSGTDVNLALAVSKVDEGLARDPRIDASTTTITPDSAAAGGYLISIEIVVGAAVLGLSFAFSAGRGITVAP